MSTNNYLLNFLHHCSEEKCGQDAIEHALVMGALTLTYNLETDVHTVFDLRSNCCDAPEQPEGVCRHCHQPAIFDRNYDRFVDAWQQATRDHGEALADVYAASGILEEILRPVPLSMVHDLETVEV